jgi:hypothetical protein
MYIVHIVYIIIYNIAEAKPKVPPNNINNKILLKLEIELMAQKRLKLNSVKAYIVLIINENNIIILNKLIIIIECVKKAIYNNLVNNTIIGNLVTIEKYEAT